MFYLVSESKLRDLVGRATLGGGIMLKGYGGHRSLSVCFRSLVSVDSWSLISCVPSGGVRHGNALRQAQDYDGNTPLIWAARGGHRACVNRLLDHGADATMVDENGNTALHFACQVRWLTSFVHGVL